MASEFAAIATIDAVHLAPRVERGDAFVVDVRKRSGPKQIYGSIRYEPGELRAAERLVLPLPRGGGLIVLYDESDPRHEVVELAQKLRAQGYGEVRVLRGGLAAWERAGGKTEEPTLVQPVPTLPSGHKISR